LSVTISSDGVVVDAVAGVDQLAVDLAGQRGLGQAGADRGGDLADRHGIVEFTAAAVGERNGDHGRTAHGPRCGRMDGCGGCRENKNGAARAPFADLGRRQRWAVVVLM
jgi:hypothetical protein